MNNTLFPLARKHKIFLSYYHYDDQFYKEDFEENFSHLFINKSVQDGDIDTDVSTEYIKRLIQSKDFLADASVLIVLCGPNTWGRKHVDWEIYGALSQKLAGRSGVIGVLLPKFPLYPQNSFRYADLPARLADNVKTGSVDVYTWQHFCSSGETVKSAMEQAFQHRLDTKSMDNSRPQLQRNLSGI
jgi:hypothetical protein